MRSYQALLLGLKKIPSFQVPDPMISDAEEDITLEANSLNDSLTDVLMSVNLC